MPAPTNDSLFPDDFRLEQVSLRISLSVNDSDNPKAPKLKGYVSVTAQQAHSIASAAAASENGIVFLDVALWESHNDTSEVYSGNVSSTSARLVFEPLSPNAPNDSEWY